MSKELIPRFVLRIKFKFPYKYNNYRKIILQYKRRNPNVTAFNVFMAIKDVFMTYWQVLKDILKYKGIIKYYPREIFIFAKDTGMIDDADTWLEFINLVNRVLEINTSDENHEIFKFAINNYGKELKTIEKNINKIFKELPQYNLEKNNGYWPVDEKPKYISSEFGVGVTDEIYKIIMDFIKSHNSINYAWLFGSRLKLTALPCSDIDLMLDISIEEFGIVKKGLEELRIPHKIDAHCLDESTAEQLYDAGGRLIYAKEDFS